MEIVREIELDGTVDDVWRLLADPDELASWVGDEARTVHDVVVDEGSRLSWSWAPDGRESTVELTLVPEGDHTRLRVVERGAARACAVGDAWDDRLFGLELRCLTQRFLATPTL
jgi:uncharacterized protein YndB with AHSA1/START domain